MEQADPESGHPPLRRRATDRAELVLGATAPQLDAGESGDLVQSLALHKIELEMQNEELQLHKLELELQNEELQDFHEELDESWKQIDQLVSERTLELHRAIKRLSSEVRVHNLAEAALRATCAEMQRLHAQLQAENAYLLQASARYANFGVLTGSSPALVRLREEIEAAAARDMPVLVAGEPGAGKGVVALAIHNRSERKHRLLVTVDCTLQPATLLEAQLFGRDAGPALEAHGQWMGRLELADQGTLFLHEGGAMPPELRARMIQVMRKGEYSPLGSSRTLRLGARIIAATARDLAEAERAGRFDPGMFEGLDVQVLRVPPLRERREDIPLLAETFVAWFNRKHGRRVASIPPAVLDDLAARPWPCNVGEFKGVVERAVLASPGEVLVLGD
ncbi:MAG: sigma 54-interacting transcriptional regulator [Holophaga sp.]|jgi:transcriptional regulator with GAF, ATPase, and Fis domain